MKPSVCILGTRGSVPVDRKDCLRYGGGTICVFLRLADQPVILDAGTGILELPYVLNAHENVIPVLLSHSHMDHLMGLPMCPVLFDRQKSLQIYGSSRNGLAVRDQVLQLMSPPLWPVPLEDVGASVTFHDVKASFDLGPIRVDTMEGNHPGGVTLFRLSAEEKSVVYITDCTLSDDLFGEVARFAADCDLLLCDGQYREDEWPDRKAFGHSTWTTAARLAVAANAKQVRIIHHDPFRTDAELDAATKELTDLHPECRFACAGERIQL